MGSHFGNQVAQSLPETLNLCGFWRRGRIPVPDARSLSMGNLNPAILRQRPVGFGNGVEVDSQVERQTAHRRQNISGAQNAFHGVCANLVYDLAVDGRCR